MKSIYLLVPALMLLPGCFSPSPETTVDAFLKAIQRGDVKAMQEHVTLSSRTLLDDTDLNPRSFHYEIVDHSIEKGKARVTVALGEKADRVRIPFILFQEENTWRIDLRQTFQEALVQEGRRAVAVMFALLEGFTHALKEIADEIPKHLNALEKNLSYLLNDLAHKMDESIKRLPRPSEAR